MKKIRSKMNAAGFSEMARGLFVSVYDSLIYYVSFKRSGYGDVLVGLAITNENFYEGSSDYFEVNKDYTPLHGFYSDCGISENSIWKNNDDNVERLFLILNRFFSSIKNYDDFKKILDGHYLSDWQMSRINSLVPQKKFNFAKKYSPVNDYLLRTRDEVREDLHNIFLKIFEGFGFSDVGEPLLYVRKRDSVFFDCFRLTLDKYAIFFRVTCFPWVKDWWKIDKNLKGGYWPMVNFELMDDNGLTSIFDTNDMHRFREEMVACWVKKLLPMSEAINTKHKFVESMSSDLTGFKLKFSRHLR